MPCFTILYYVISCYYAIYHIMLCPILLDNTLLFYISLYDIMLDCTTLYNILLCCTAVYHNILCSTLVYPPIPYSTPLYPAPVVLAGTNPASLAGYVQSAVNSLEPEKLEGAPSGKAPPQGAEPRPALSTSIKGRMVSLGWSLGSLRSSKGISSWEGAGICLGRSLG